MEYLADTVTVIRHFSETGEISSETREKILKLILEDTSISIKEMSQ